MRTFAPAFGNGVIAQLVEQRTENPCVPGSIPGDTTKVGAASCNGKSFFVLISLRIKDNSVQRRAQWSAILPND